MIPLWIKVAITLTILLAVSGLSALCFADERYPHLWKFLLGAVLVNHLGMALGLLWLYA